MIVTDIAHLADQVMLTPALQKALAFLQALPAGPLSDGRIEIDGDNVFALVQSYETQTDAWLFEGHRKSRHPVRRLRGGSDRLDPY